MIEIKRWRTRVCNDCGVAIHKQAIRCRKCNNTGRHNPMFGRRNFGRFIDGRSSRLTYCIDCGLLKLSSYRALRCWKCSSKYKKIILKGENGPNWQGGITSVNRRLRASTDFKEWRKAVFERDNYTCQMCLLRSRRGQQIYLHPHHIKLFSKYPKFRFEVSNGLTLCSNCHKKIHTLKRSIENVRRN
jgi:hypothetical protein